LESLYKYIPDAGATVVLVIFMILWDRRTRARDIMWRDLMSELVKGWLDCVKAIEARTTRD